MQASKVAPAHTHPSRPTLPASNCCAYISIDHAAIHYTWLVNRVGIFWSIIKECCFKEFPEFSTWWLQASFPLPPLPSPGPPLTGPTLLYSMVAIDSPCHWGYWLKWTPLCRWDYSLPKHCDSEVENQWLGTDEMSPAECFPRLMQEQLRFS